MRDLHTLKDLKELAGAQKQPGVFIYYRSPTCPHCVKIEPKMKQFNQALLDAKMKGTLSTKIKMVKFDVNLDPEHTLTQSITTIPQLVLSKNEKNSANINFASITPEQLVDAMNDQQQLLPENMHDLQSMVSFINTRLAKAEKDGFTNPLGSL